jgi:hypothetical protein
MVNAKKPRVEFSCGDNIVKSERQERMPIPLWLYLIFFLHSSAGEKGSLGTRTFCLAISPVDVKVVPAFHFVASMMICWSLRVRLQYDTHMAGCPTPGHETEAVFTDVPEKLNKRSR